MFFYTIYNKETNNNTMDKEEIIQKLKEINSKLEVVTTNLQTSLQLLIKENEKNAKKQ